MSLESRREKRRRYRRRKRERERLEREGLGGRNLPAPSNARPTQPKVDLETLSPSKRVEVLLSRGHQPLPLSPSFRMPPVCQYCGQESRRARGEELHPHRVDLFDKKFWYCEPCQAWVGCDGGGRPLGTLAKADLRKARAAAHSALDPLWERDVMGKDQAYRWLAGQLRIPSRDCHIGLLDTVTCARVVEVCDVYKATHGITL